jgi:hypothetical protein
LVNGAIGLEGQGDEVKWPEQPPSIYGQGGQPDQPES